MCGYLRRIRFDGRQSDAAAVTGLPRDASQAPTFDASSRTDPSRSDTDDCHHDLSSAVCPAMLDTTSGLTLASTASLTTTGICATTGIRGLPLFSRSDSEVVIKAFHRGARLR